jgi:hypothetical protein
VSHRRSQPTVVDFALLDFTVSSKSRGMFAALVHGSSVDLSGASAYIISSVEGLQLGLYLTPKFSKSGLEHL